MVDRELSHNTTRKTSAGWAVMRDQRIPLLSGPRTRRSLESSTVFVAGWPLRRYRCYWITPVDLPHSLTVLRSYTFPVTRIPSPFFIHDLFTIGTVVPSVTGS